VWFIAYRHSLRPDEAGLKFVHEEAEAVAGGERLKAQGYVITKVAPTSQARMDAFMAGTLSDPDQRFLS
jgi:hypothetical protein